MCEVTSRWDSSPVVGWSSTWQVLEFGVVKIYEIKGVFLLYCILQGIVFYNAWPYRVASSASEHDRSAEDSRNDTCVALGG